MHEKPFRFSVILVAMRQYDLARRGIVDQHGVTMGELSDLVRHVLPGEDCWWSRLPEFCRVRLKPDLERQFPRIKALDLGKVHANNWIDWIRVQKVEFGEHLMVVGGEER